MTTVYPGAIDSLTNPSGSDQLSSPSHADQHSDANDAIEAIETELGTDPAGTEATVADRLDKLNTPGCLAATRNGTNLSFPSGGSTVIVWNAAEAEDDENGELTLNTSTGEITVNRTGWYHVDCAILLSGGTSGYRSLEFRVDGTPHASNRKVPNSTVAHSIELSRLVKITAGAVLTVTFGHNQGTDLSLTADDERNYLSIARVR